MGGNVLMSKDLETDPRFMRLCVTFRHAEASRGVTLSVTQSVTIVMGCLTRLWQYADTHIRPDNTLPMSVSEIDDYLGYRISASMPEDWLASVDASSVELPDYLDRNGVESRKRHMATIRQRRKRLRAMETENRDSVTHASRASHADVTPPVTDAVLLPSRSRPYPTQPEREREAHSLSTEPVAAQRAESQTEIPDVPGLDRPSVVKFIAHRGALSGTRPLTAMGLASLCEKLAAHPVAVQQRMVARSMEGGWPGLYPLPADELAELSRVNGSGAHAPNGAGHGEGDEDPNEWTETVWAGLIDSDGAWPERTPGIQRAIDAAGGWSAIRMRTEFNAAKLKAAFIADLLKPMGDEHGQH